MTWLNERENEQERYHQSQNNFKNGLDILLSLSSRLRMLPVNKHGYWFRYEMGRNYLATAHKNRSEYKKRDGYDASWTDYYRYLSIEHQSSNAEIKLYTEDRAVTVENYYDDDESSYRGEYKYSPSTLYTVNVSISKLKTISELDWLVLLGWCMNENSIDQAKTIM